MVVNNKFNLVLVVTTGVVGNITLLQDEKFPIHTLKINGCKIEV